MCFHTRTPDMESRGAYSTGICPVEQGFVTLNEEIRTILSKSAGLKDAEYARQAQF